MDNYNDPFHNNGNQNQNNYNQNQVFGYNQNQSYGYNQNQGFGYNQNHNQGANNSAQYSKNNSIFLKRVLPIILAVLLLVTGFVLGFFIKPYTLSEEERIAQWVMETIDNNCLYDLSDADKEYILSNLGKYAVYSVDQYSDFYTPTELMELIANFQGEYVGVGFSYGQAEDEDGNPTFVYVSQVFGSYVDPTGKEEFIKTPAEGKLEKYDRFVSLTYNGKTTYFEKDVRYPDGSEFKEYASLRDIYYAFEDIPLNKTFSVVVNRNGVNTAPIELKRIVYNPAFVRYDDNTTLSGLDNKTAVITLMSFMGHAEEEIKAAISKFVKDGKENLILDLRDNGGGSIDVAAGIASYFINDSKNSKNLTVGYLERKNGQRETILTKSNNYCSAIKKIVILFNGGTASASEILIGAMLEYDTNNKIQTLGTQSYGKGICQSPYEMLGYCIYLTDARVLWPKSYKCIHKVRVTPNNIVENNYFSLGVDNQLNAAISSL